ncbi:steroidogenic acute regulatory protein-like [Ischnura elegans]|uniref:steroidogenic acute regulatory protein-like n=1 Tax=Ischnura elegans TaxID=197161 RepID=UPI001ED879FE|nr:steroidogenic acute regulatory protein-like [Ischnura elegans]
MDRDREVRAAVESMMSGNVLGNQGVYSQPNRSSSIEGLSSIDLSHSINTNRGEYSNEDLFSGCRQDGRMSVVRRFFCLFVTFDLLFTVFMWLICIMMIGDDIYSALVKQVVNFSIHTSLFDIVAAAAARFTLLIMFYALLYINHWIIIAISTSGTCAFLIAKVFLYHWADARQPAFHVVLILTSFVMSWGEAWFLDFRVLPQESHARRFLYVSNPGGTNMPSERDPLIGNHHNYYSDGRMDVTSGNFYSPMDSPEVSDDERGDGYLKVDYHRKLTPKEEEYKSKGKEALTSAWRLIKSDGWRLEKRGSEDKEGGDPYDEVFSMHLGSSKGKKIYLLKGRVELSPKFLLNELFHRIDNVPNWNPTLIESYRIQVVDDHTDISYQVTAEGGGGIVSSRDFVNLRHWDVVEGSYISAGLSITHPEKPPVKKYVRGENGPGCWAMSPIPGESGSCKFQWLLDTNLKGWLTPYVVDGALTVAMFDYIRHLRIYAKWLNSSQGPLSHRLPIENQDGEQVAVES